ncbi:Dickkopf N-terminal cysteine-rich domain-containing protein, partial [Patescibacteria group bacterium]
LVCGDQSLCEVPPQPEGGACTVDTDCITDLVCNDGVCSQPQPVDGPCVEDGDCESGLVCGDQSLCEVPPQPEGGFCLSDSDCESGLICFGGACSQPQPEGEFCFVDGDCEEGLICVDAVCSLPPSDPECLEDIDCPNVEACEGGVCVPFQPEGGICSEDSDCLPGLECLNDICNQPPTPCESEDDCADDLVCWFGYCLTEIDDGNNGTCVAGEAFICHNQRQ